MSTNQLHDTIRSQSGVLKFSTTNSKLRNLGKYLKAEGLCGVTKISDVVSFDLPAGWTCPNAHICQTFAHPVTGKMHKGPGCEVQCYAAGSESAFTNCRKFRWSNYRAIRQALISGDTEQDKVWNVATLIEGMIDASKPKVIRLHSSGDFFDPSYATAWMITALFNPGITIFGYTKVFAVYARIKGHNILHNMKFVYSLGGTDDHLVTSRTQTCSIAQEQDDNTVCYYGEASDHEDFLEIVFGNRNINIVEH